MVEYFPTAIRYCVNLCMPTCTTNHVTKIRVKQSVICLDDDNGCDTRAGHLLKLGDVAVMRAGFAQKKRNPRDK